MIILFCRSRTGNVWPVSFKVALLLMAEGSLEDKYRGILFLQRNLVLNLVLLQTLSVLNYGYIGCFCEAQRLMNIEQRTLSHTFYNQLKTVFFLTVLESGAPPSIFLKEVLYKSLNE